MPASHDISEIEDVFDLWESLAEMARDLEVPYQRLAKWSQRGRIPHEYLDQVAAAATRKLATVSPELLGRLNKPRGTVAAEATG